jgi:hypothetical protein
LAVVVEAVAVASRAVAVEPVDMFRLNRLKYQTKR